VSEESARPEAEVIDEATSFLRRLGAAGSQATVLALSLIDPVDRDVVSPFGGDAGPTPDVRPPVAGGADWTADVADELARRLAPLIRSTDLLRQVRDGEFLLVVPSGGELAGPALADRVRGVAALPFTTGSGTFSLVVQVGAATFSPDLEDPSIVIDAARADARGGH